MLHRRNFIKVMVAGSATILIPSIFNRQPVQASESTMDVSSGWDSSAGETDPRIIVLSYALLAPNPNNIQPWLVELTGERSFNLFVDFNRLLLVSDPLFRQVHIGQGTFLENLDLAAQHLGYQTNIRYFPQGMYSNTVLEYKPVASVELIEDSSVKVDPLFNQIMARRSNKTVYGDRPLSPREIDQLLLAYDTRQYPLTITTDSAQKQRLAELTMGGVRIEATDESLLRELAHTARLTQTELEQYRNGLDLTSLGAQGVTREQLVDSNSPFNFGRLSIEAHTEWLNSRAAFAWITSLNNTRLDQVQVGRAYERVNLTATALGLAMHPHSQLLPEYESIIALQQEFKNYLGIPEDHTVQMFFRLGHADPVPPSPRRQVRGLLST